jgi:hypothetical protein
MGHLTLIAEEVVKFTERHPPELLSESVLEKVMAQDWVNYVEGALAETRERDNAILGGVRPEVAMSRASAQGLMGGGFSGLSSIGLGGGGSSALADAGLNGGTDVAEGSGSGGIGPFAISAGTLMSGFGSSSDEEDDEEQDTEEDVNNEVGGLDSRGDFLPNFDMFASLSGSASKVSRQGNDGAGGVASDTTRADELDYDYLPDAWNGPSVSSSSEYGYAPINFFRGFSRLMSRLGERG